MNAEVVVVGGGLAGPAAAIGLARAGRDVILIERAAAPEHKVCGEFLSGEAVAYLHSLGLNLEKLGAVPIRAVRLTARGAAAGSGATRAKLPFPALSLTRRRLDDHLLHVAEQAGVTVIRGCRVDALESEPAGWVARLANGQSISAPTAFLATGKHDLRGRPRSNPGSTHHPRGLQAGMVAFKMYFRLQPHQAAELDSHVELLVYRGGYGGLQPVEDGAANLCCLVDRDELRRIGGRWEDLLAAMQAQCPHLAARLHGAEPLLPRPLAISAIPYGFVRAQSEPGLWALGDQAAVIPSFTGDGMSIALHSGCLAAAMYLRGATSAEFQRSLRRHVGGQVRLATTLSRALVWPPTRGLCVGLVRLWPSILRSIARQTRLRESAVAPAAL